MIITVTMNPAIDKTAELDTFVHEGLNRLQNPISDVGGKGINVSKTIHALGGESIATGFLAGNNGKMIQETLRIQGIKTDFLFVEGETRVNLKVIEPGGVLTELNEPGPTISEEVVEELMQKLESYANPDNLFVLAGSVPKGVRTGVYGEMIQRIKAKGAKVFLDVDGKLFEEALPYGPNIIKPNKFELEQYFAKGELEIDTMVELAAGLKEKGIETIAISMGKDGAIFLNEGEAKRAPGLKIKAHSAVGAGDAMVAAISYGMNQGYEMDEWMKLAVATSAGAVVTIGTKPPTKELVEELKKEVVIESIPKR